MKKTSGILLTLLLSSQFAFAEIKTDDHRVEVITNWGKTISFKFSSIDYVTKTKLQDGKFKYTMSAKSIKGLSEYSIDKDTYEEIIDYMEDSK